MKKLMMMAAVMGALVAQADFWKGLGEANYYSGPKLTEADLLGKVVLVDCWGVNCPPCRALLPRMEQIWQSFKSKPFVLLGSHRQGNAPEKVAELVKANKLTYPQYNGAGVASGEPSFRGIPFLYVVNHRGKIVYAGSNEREATEAVVNAIGEVGGAYNLAGGVVFRKYKAMEKQLVLGKPTKTIVKKLEGDVKKASGKTANAAQKEQAEEAREILKALEEAKSDIKKDIEIQKVKNPVDALKTIKAYMASFPEEGAAYKDEIPDLTAKAKEFAAEQKKAAAAKKAK